MSTIGNYLQHKETLRKYGLLNVISAAIASLTLIILFFAPCFSYSSIFHFSLFDELKYCLDAIINGGFSIDSILAIYSLIGCVMIAAAFIWMTIEAIRTTLKLKNLDEFAMMAYDDIVHRVGNKKRNNWQSGPWGLLYTGITFILIDVLIFGRLFTSGYYGFDATYLTIVDGISAWGIFALLLLVAVIVLKIVAYSFKNSVKKAVIKAEFEATLAQAKAEAAAMCDVLKNWNEEMLTYPTK